MTITTRAGSRLVFLCLCHFGMPLKVVILVPWLINAADNRAGMITISRDSDSLRRRSAQRQAEIDRATSLNRQATRRLDQGRYDEADPLLKRALANREKARAQVIWTAPKASTTWRDSTTSRRNTRSRYMNRRSNMGVKGETQKTPLASVPPRPTTANSGSAPAPPGQGSSIVKDNRKKNPRRERLHKDWPIKVPVYPCWPLGEPPVEMWDTAHEMRRLWNAFVFLFRVALE